MTGSGPYILSKVDRGKKLTLMENMNWWGRSVDFFKKQYQPKKVVFRYIKVENVEIEMLKKGKIDFLGLTPEAYMKKTEGKQ